MAVMIDIIGSVVIAGIVLLAILGLNANMNQAMYNKTFSLVTQTNAVALARMIEYDVTKIGYHTPSPALLVASPDTISFKADLKDDGTVHTVKYFSGSTSTLSWTKNPNDRMVYRVLDGSVTSMNLGVTSLVFKYYDVNGIVTTDPKSVKSVNVYFTVQSPEPVDTGYCSSYWQKTINSKNLNIN